jgi:uncharacterized protein YuzE
MCDMGQKRLKVWYDADADLIEIFFDGDTGYYEPTSDDRVTVRLNAKGHITGFTILGAKTAQGDPIDIDIKAEELEKIERD